MSIVSPYHDTFQYTRIKLEPHNFNSDLESNLLHVLRQKESKKCNKNGFIDEIYKIENFNGGFISPDNLSGNVMFDVKYNCRICFPTIRSTLVAQVKTINQELIVCTNGPIFILFQKMKLIVHFGIFLKILKIKNQVSNLKKMILLK